MAEIKWTEQAINDIEAIADYITRDSENYAKMHVKKIYDSVTRLSQFPESGRIVPEINKKEIREILLGTYRIIYRFKHNVVEILTIYHSSRLLNQELLSV